MEHLPVHLPYEARIAGPVQYRWMYPFERYLGTLKRMIGNKASVEGSICEAYLMTESTQLFSHYFEPHVMTRNHNVDRNDDGGDKEDIEGNLSIFSHPGRLWGEAKKRDLSLEEIKAAQTYILLNCEEVEPFVSMFMQRLQEEFPNLSQGQIDESFEANFSIWFKEFVQCNPIENEFLHSLARGPLIDATSYSAYFVNGYKFHTECHGSTRSTMNSRVCISDPNFGDYYGRIKEIIQVEYREAPLKQIVLFKCEWFDPTMDVGVKRHNQYKLVDINHRRRYKKYEPFILAMQATQVCYVPYPSKKKDKDDWAAVLKVKPQNVIELPNEEVATVSEVNVPFQVEEVEVHEIDITVSIDENILLNDPNGDVIEMDEPIDDGLLQENHEIHIESTEEEYETEETEENEDEEEEEFEEDSMARGRGRGKSSGRSNPAIRVSMPTIPKPTIVSPQQGGTPTNTSTQSISPTISETPPATSNQSNLIGMARGRGRGKSSGRSNPAIRVSMPTIPKPTIVSPQQGGTPTNTSTQSISPTIFETPPATSNQSNLIGQHFSTQSNSTGHTSRVAECESNSSHTRTLVFLTSAGLEPSQICSSFISKSFKSNVDPNGINWKGVSTDVRNGYFGEFKKKFYWDVSISENEVKRHLMVKAALKYRNFISKIKKEGVRPEINSKNRRGGHETAVGTHTGGSISIGEHRRKLAIEKGRDPTPIELHLHFHTHGHDGKSFVGERSQIVHEKYEEILRNNTVSQTDIDQREAYYQAAGGEKKRRIYGLGSEAKNYYEQNLCGSSSLPPPFSQSTSITNMDEFIKQMMPALTSHLVPIIVGQVQASITPSGNPSIVTPIVPPATNVDEVDPSISSDDRIP
ncbi:hypothetical protein KY285_022580 [Solanum tuberosum]|nr:hypothetical protein KY285_022580 [Solanum tuberosum]